MQAPTLRDPSLLVQKTYINGEWVDSVSGKTFAVHGKLDIIQSKIGVF